ncbi:MAG: hypothetical protein ACXACY_19760 [Candidatus Hodarchaeales archaeon]|jgi:hypothetical protein
MVNFAHLYSVIISWLVIPCLAIIGIFFYKKQKSRNSLIFATGIVVMAFGQLMILFSPFQKMTFDEVGNMLSSSGPPLSWYGGSILFSTGLIITTVGFALITFQDKNIRT